MLFHPHPSPRRLLIAETFSPVISPGQFIHGVLQSSPLPRSARMIDRLRSNFVGLINAGRSDARDQHKSRRCFDLLRRAPSTGSPSRRNVGAPLDRSRFQEALKATCRSCPSLGALSSIIYPACRTFHYRKVHYQRGQRCPCDARSTDTVPLPLPLCV